MIIIITDETVESQLQVSAQGAEKEVASDTNGK